MFMADVAYIADHPNMPLILLSALTNTRGPALSLMIGTLSEGMSSAFLT